jgi:hypothetical protein
MGKGAIVSVVFVVASFGGLGACGNDGPGPYGYGAIGAPCGSDYDCGGTFCVAFRGGTCQAGCRNDLDCGPGFHCHDENRRGTGGKIDVCIPN